MPNKLKIFDYITKKPATGMAEMVLREPTGGKPCVASPEKGRGSVKKALSALEVECHIKVHIEVSPSVSSGLRLAPNRNCELILPPLDVREWEFGWPYARQVCLRSWARLRSIRAKPAKRSRTFVRDIWQRRGRPGLPVEVVVRPVMQSNIVSPNCRRRPSLSHPAPA